MPTDLSAAKSACEERNFPKAVELLESYLETDQDDGRGWELFGMALHALGNHERSVPALERAALLVPLFPTARVRIATGYGVLGRLQLSRDLLNEILSCPELTPELLLEVAMGFDKVDQPARAIQACRRAVSLDPQVAQSYYALGYYAAKYGHPASYSISLAHKAVFLEPANASFRIGLASLLQKAARDDEAYVVVKDLSDAQIESIDCTCCIERILRLYDTARDFHRISICLSRQFELHKASTEDGSTAM